MSISRTNFISLSTAIILAGGLGTRLRSITHDLIPKPMVLVQNKPFLFWQLQYLYKQGLTKIIIAVSHHGAVISNHFGSSFQGIPLTYSIESTPLGTGGAIRQALEYNTEEHIYILNGDTYFPITLNNMLQMHQSHRNDMTLALKLVKGSDRYGGIKITSQHTIIGFYEKKWMESGYINGGIYIANKYIFNHWPLGQNFSVEKELFEKNDGRWKLGGYKSRAKFIDIGIPEDYEKIQSFNLR